jgi:putative CRISPR-associated protein (TIGR02619 family)
MQRVVVSTIGTSLLTQQIDRAASEESSWYNQLRDTANCRANEISSEISAIVATLKQRALDILQQDSIPSIRKASAELNGIYGLYREALNQGDRDIHYLIATDTAQGQAAAEIVQDFLRSRGIKQTAIYTPSNLSTKSSTDFSSGIDDLIVWLRREVAPLRSSYHVCFNLVGSFKSLQGYMNTIGMFYADEIIYIFEGKDSSLISIPRLPINVDRDLLKPHAVALAMMDAGAGLDRETVRGIPETLLGEVDGKFVLSTWGKLIWDEARQVLLARELLIFPGLSYAQTFREDYNKITDVSKRIALQADLAGVSYRLQDSRGETSALRSFDYTRYQNSDAIDHFRVDRSLRISCRKSRGDLELRYYGTHKHVEGKEKV